jgi:hypothetical protein
MPRMPSFVRYVLSFKRDDTPAGDVARDIAMDTRIDKRWGHERLIEHINNNHGLPIVIDILEDLVYKYDVARINSKW